METADLVARLNPTTVKYNVGRGGMAELSNQDIAAAIAFIKEPLARELFCHVYWPAGADLTRGRLEDMLLDILRNEHRNRSSRLLDAELMIESPTVSRGRANSAYALAKAGRWPKWVREEQGIPQRSPVYAGIRRAVLDELRMGHNGIDGCAHARVFGERQRAAMIGISRSTFLDKWEGVYAWLLDYCKAQILLARTEFHRALR